MVEVSEVSEVSRVQEVQRAKVEGRVGMVGLRVFVECEVLGLGWGEGVPGGEIRRSCVLSVARSVQWCHGSRVGSVGNRL